jgi:hypothetical protein
MSLPLISPSSPPSSHKHPNKTKPEIVFSLNEEYFEIFRNRLFKWNLQNSLINWKTCAEPAPVQGRLQDMREDMENCHEACPYL